MGRVGDIFNDRTGSVMVVIVGVADFGGVAVFNFDLKAVTFRFGIIDDVKVVGRAVGDACTGVSDGDRHR